MRLNKSSIFWVILIIVFAAVCRLLPHPANFTPLGAMMLFGGTMSKKFKVISFVPFLALYLADLYLNNFAYPSDHWVWFYKGAYLVYPTFGLLFLIGWFVRPKIGMQLALTSIASSIVFFIITNIGVWYASGWYTVDGSGLVKCFVAALPFFQNSVLGDLFFSFTLFGAYYFVTAKSKAVEPA